MKQIISHNHAVKYINLFTLFISSYSTLLRTSPINGFFTIVPIIASIDSLGLIILVTKEKSDNTNLARLMAKILADKVNIY